MIYGRDYRKIKADNGIDKRIAILYTYINIKLYNNINLERWHGT